MNVDRDRLCPADDTSPACKPCYNRQDKCPLVDKKYQGIWYGGPTEDGVDLMMLDIKTKPVGGTTTPIAKRR
jgi:hypothetical protein